MDTTSLKQLNLKQIKHYKIWGRTDETIHPLPLFWTGSGIELNVSGSELWIDIEVSYDSYEPWIAFNINGAFISRQATHRGRNSICIYKNSDSSSVKNIFFYKETQPFNDDSNHTLCIQSIKTDGHFFPIASKPYRLEFIGDSISSGEGTYGAVTEEAWLPMFMSASRNYAVHTSQMLNAEYRILSQSGWGICTSWDNNHQHNLPSCYEQICSLAKGARNEQAGALLPHNFSSWKPNAIIINLGTNDASAMSYYPVSSDLFLSEVSNAVKTFLQCIRKNNPQAQIIWIYGMLGSAIENCIQSSIAEYNLSQNDTVHYYPLPDTPIEKLGSRQHPGEKMHYKVAILLKEYLTSILSSSVLE